MKILKEMRTAKGMTQADLGKILKISPSTIGMYEQGRREPDNKTLMAMANFFGVTTDYLLGNTPTTNNITVNGNNNGAISGSGSATSNNYYYDEEVAELADRMKNQPGMRILFDAAKDVSKEDLETVAKMMEGLKKTRRQD